MGEDGVAYTGEVAVQEPDKIRIEFNVEVSGMTFTFVRVVNGDKGWVHVMDTTQEMGQAALAEAKEGLYAGRVKALGALTGKGFTLAPLGESKVGDRPVVGVRVSHKGHRDINLFFDKKSGLLLKSERRAKDEMGGGEFTQEELYDDYKEVGGVQHAMKITI